MSWNKVFLFLIRSVQIGSIALLRNYLIHGHMKSFSIAVYTIGLVWNGAFRREAKSFTTAPVPRQFSCIVSLDCLLWPFSAHIILLKPLLRMMLQPSEEVAVSLHVFHLSRLRCELGEFIKKGKKTFPSASPRIPTSPGTAQLTSRCRHISIKSS